MILFFLVEDSRYTFANLYPAFRQMGAGQRVLIISAFHLPSAQDSPYGKVACLGVSCSATLQKPGLRITVLRLSFHGHNGLCCKRYGRLKYMATIIHSSSHPELSISLSWVGLVICFHQ